MSLADDSNANSPTGGSAIAGIPHELLSVEPAPTPSALIAEILYLYDSSETIVESV